MTTDTVVIRVPLEQMPRVGPQDMLQPITDLVYTYNHNVHLNRRFERNLRILECLDFPTCMRDIWRSLSEDIKFLFCGVWAFPVLEKITGVAAMWTDPLKSVSGFFEEELSFEPSFSASITNAINSTSDVTWFAIVQAQLLGVTRQDGPIRTYDTAPMDPADPHSVGRYRRGGFVIYIPSLSLAAALEWHAHKFAKFIRLLGPQRIVPGANPVEFSARVVMETELLRHIADIELVIGDLGHVLRLDRSPVPRTVRWQAPTDEFEPFGRRVPVRGCRRLERPGSAFDRLGRETAPLLIGEARGAPHLAAHLFRALARPRQIDPGWATVLPLPRSHRIIPYAETPAPDVQLQPDIARVKREREPMELGVI